MSTNVEIEAKILVSEKDFQQVFKFLHLNESDAVTQINYYIDTPTGELRNFGFGLRIRKRLDDYTLTLKSPLAEGTLEKNQLLTKKDYERLAKEGIFPEGPAKQFLETLGFDVATLRIITHLTTKRLETIYNGRHLALDHNEYNGIVDYEIESEQSAISLAQETLKLLCTEAGIAFSPNSISKHARALRAMNEKL